MTAPLKPRPGLAARAATAATAVVSAPMFPAFAALGRRRGARPLHPRGVLSEATLHVEDDGSSGVPVLDTPGEHPCVVRVSRGVGRPTGRLDIPGLAIRFPGAGPEGRDADLLLAATGLGPVSRHFLALRHRADDGPVTTLWPCLTAAGPTMIAAHPLGPVDEADPRGARYALGWARSRGEWHRVGVLTLGEPRPDDLRFDSVEHPLCGTRQYPWVEAARLPAYAGARAGGPTGPSTPR
ncbi:phosphodiesterase [Mobilicoccus pelagius]|nr:phosphodiesterase [Mobilicoccus pelagius]